MRPSALARLSAVLLVLLAAILPARASAQSTSSWLECAVDPNVGCSQGTLFVQLQGLAAPTLVHGFSFTFTPAAPWRFAAAQAGEVSDGSDLGFTFYAPVVSPDQRSLVGAFDPGFEAYVEPTPGRNTIGVSVQFDPTQSAWWWLAYPPGSAVDPIAFGVDYDYTLSLDGPPTTTTPEPASVALLGAGVLALAVVRGARRRRVSAVLPRRD